MEDFKNLGNVLQGLSSDLPYENKDEEDGLLTKAKKAGESVLDAMSAPQRYLSNAMAKGAGLPISESPTENFSNLVQAGADKLGLGNSTAANAAKALAVGAADVFLDPMNLIPIGEIAKGAESISKFKPVAEAIEKLSKGAKVDEGLAELGNKLVQQVKPIEQTVTGQKWANILEKQGTNAVPGIDAGLKEVEGKIIQPIKPAAETTTGQKWAEAAKEQAGVSVPETSRFEKDAEKVKSAKHITHVGNKISEHYDEMVKDDAKKFAMQNIRHELANHPELARDREYLKQRLIDLSNFYYNQKKIK